MTYTDDDVVLASYARTPFGRARKGTLVDVRPDDLAVVAAGAALEQAGLTARDVEDFYLGCAEPHDEHGQNIARRVAVLLGADELPGSTINRFCASSLQAVRMAFHAIRAGEGDAFLVGGVEAVSRYGPISLARNPRFDDAERHVAEQLAGGNVWRNPRESGQLPDIYVEMGLTAEFVADLTGTSREEQDSFALLSQERAARALAADYFAAEIVPVPLGDGALFEIDESPRPATTAEGLASLAPAFRDGGSVTAGNACPLNDGAAAAVVTSGRRARVLGIEPLARIIATGVSALSPETMGLGPIEASRRALSRAGLTPGDIDLVELNEAFAAQVIPSIRELGLDLHKVNVHGGAIALGHPFGATGVRLVGTLARGLRVTGGRYGLATLCIGGGQGMAMVLESVA